MAFPMWSRSQSLYCTKYTTFDYICFMVGFLSWKNVSMDGGGGDGSMNKQIPGSGRHCKERCMKFCFIDLVVLPMNEISTYTCVSYLDSLRDMSRHVSTEIDCNVNIDDRYTMIIVIGISSYFCQCLG
jgi:hypothetical protein